MNLLRIAHLRLALGDVRRIPYPEHSRLSWAVACRPALNDNRKDAANYWPDENARCLCRYSKAEGICSHTLAVMLAKWGAGHAAALTAAAARSRAKISTFEQVQRRKAWTKRQNEWVALIDAGQSTWGDPMFCAEYRAFNAAERVAS